MHTLRQELELLILDYKTEKQLLKFALNHLLDSDERELDMSDSWEGISVNGKEFDINFYSDEEYGSGVTNGTNVTAYGMVWNEEQKSWKRNDSQWVVLFTRWGADLTLRDGEVDFEEIGQ